MPENQMRPSRSCTMMTPRQKQKLLKKRTLGEKNMQEKPVLPIAFAKVQAGIAAADKTVTLTPPELAMFDAWHELCRYEAEKVNAADREP